MLQLPGENLPLRWSDCMLNERQAYLLIDIALHGYEQVVKGLVMPKGAVHCQLGVQVIL